MAIKNIKLRKFSWQNTVTKDEYYGDMVNFGKSIPETDGTSEDCARFDHNHEAKKILYDADYQFINQINKTKLYDLRTRNDNDSWVSSEISRIILQITWKDSVNYYSQLSSSYPTPVDGWLVPVLQDEGSVGPTFHPSGDYRYHDNTAHPTGQATGWYLVNSTKVPLATGSNSGLLSAGDYTKLQNLKYLPDFGTGHDQIARGDHNHDSVYLKIVNGVLNTDGRLKDDRNAKDVYAWAKQPTRPVYSFSEITNKPTTIGGYGITDGVLNTDARLTNPRPASDVYPWAKAVSKPGYSAAEVGAIPTSASCNKNWNWSGQAGQPTWVWGGTDGTNMYVYNPSNFNVNSATYSNNCNADLQVNGNWIRGVADIAFSSDINLKTNLVKVCNKITNGVLDIQPYQYEFKNDLGTKRIGYIAQDVQKLYPDMVLENEEKELSFSYRELMILKIEALVEEVKMLKKEIEKLKSDILC